MEYTVDKLAKMSGISRRTLRYYDQIGLLVPLRTSSNGYRIYGQKEVDRLQTILFYRELDVPLSEISQMLSDKQFDRSAALTQHLILLSEKRERLDLIISNIEKTLKSIKGEIVMNDFEKFDGLKLVKENEEKFGDEIRKKYGDEQVNRSNAKVASMTPEQYAEVTKLSEDIATALKEAVRTGDPQGEAAQQLCELHKKWLCYYWDSYSKEAHLGLGHMYVADERFAAYYNNIVDGGAEFLRDALEVFCG